MKDRKLFHRLYEELDAYLKSLQGLYIDSLLGYFLIYREIDRENESLKKFIEDSEITSEKFQEQLSFSHEHFTGEAIPTAGLFFHKKGEVKTRVKKGGYNEYFIGDIIIVALYAYWETYFREKVAKAYEKRVDKYTNYFWGDLRLLRNVVIHKSQKSIAEFKKGAKTPFFREVSKMGTILLNREIVSKILLLACVFRNSLFSESLPKIQMKVPLK